MSRMVEFLAPFSEMLLVLLGAVTAIGGQFVFDHQRVAHRRKEIALAIEEELRGTVFDPQGFGGFSDQAFDTFLADIPILPDETARKILRYYFRMKHLKRFVGIPGAPDIGDVAEIRDQLVGELKLLSRSGKTPSTPKRLRE